MSTEDDKMDIEDMDWDELTEDQQEAAKTIGYTKAVWDKGGVVPADDLEWDELTGEQRRAATTLGFDEEKWNKGKGCCGKCVIS